MRVSGGDGSVILYPAIDISEGKAVRLVKGDFNQVTVYEDSPLEAARAWVDAGARFLHVVDLDGARTGSPKSLDHLEQIAQELHVPVQYGGGLRTLPAVRDALRAGAERVILGTAAFNDIDFLDDVLGAFRDRTIVSVDTRGGHVSTSGWQETTQMPAEAVIERLQNRGVRSFVYTDVDRDGMLGGIDFEKVRRIAQAVRGRFIYSGGIGSLDDLRGLRDLRQVNLGGVIAGKALYEGRFTIAEGQRALQPETGERPKKPYRPVPAGE
jgi:phosphoribosylformimino-5-aminoimidazole carboxamide ribotide isomerase